MIGRRVLVGADLDRVQAVCDGELVADHERAWARHQTLSDPNHVEAAKVSGASTSVLLGRYLSPRWRSVAWMTTTLRWASTSMVGGVMASAKTTVPARDASSEIAYLTRALKAPTLRDSAARLAERARAENWSHEEYLVAYL